MTQNVLFLLVLVAALGFFSYNAQRLVRYLTTGHDEHRTDHPWTRLRNVVVIGIALRAGNPISFWEFTRKGAVITAITILVAAPYLWLRYFVLS